MNNSSLLRVLVLVFVILYIVSPIDACVGPIDDIIVAVLGVACQKKLRRGTNA